MDEREAGTSTARPVASAPAPATSAILTLPNVISLVRLASVPVFVWLFVSGREDAAVILYGVGASTDWLDGYIARRTGAVSELGKLLDPLADRIFIVALVVALVARDTLPLWLAVVIVARDVIVLSAFPLLDRRHLARIPVNFIGKSATAALLFGLTWLAVSETSLGIDDLARGIGMTFTILGAILYWVAGAMYGREALKRVRTLPSEPKEPLI
jgi:cardiolipin synthase